MSASFLTPLTTATAALDYVSYMASPNVIQTHSDGRWPVQGFTFWEDLELVAQHEKGADKTHLGTRRSRVKHVVSRTRASNAARSAVCRSGGVLLVGHVLEPGHNFAVVVCLLDGDVSHEPARRGTVPVFLAGLDVDHIPGPDLMRLAAAAGDVPDAVGDVEGLPVRVVSATRCARQV